MHVVLEVVQGTKQVLAADRLGHAPVLADKYIRACSPRQMTWGNVIMYLVRPWLQFGRGGTLVCGTDARNHNEERADVRIRRRLLGVEPVGVSPNARIDPVRKRVENRNIEQPSIAEHRDASDM